jgi:hypothetical protein
LALARRKGDTGQVGNVGFSCRQAFHALGPLRKMLTCEETEDNATHRTCRFAVRLR